MAARKPKSAAQILADANDLARKFYGLLDTGPEKATCSTKQPIRKSKCAGRS